MFIPTHISTSDPTVTDGVNNGFRKSNYWLNSSSGALFVCKDDSNTAAVWTQVNPTQAQNVSYVKVSLDSTAVGNLGTAQTLIAKPDAGDAIELIDMVLRINVSTTLEVGTQSLLIGYKIGATYVFTLDNVDVETATTKIFKLTEKTANPQIFEADDIVAVLDGTANPSSGSATMDFYIVYKTITL